MNITYPGMVELSFIQGLGLHFNGTTGFRHGTSPETMSFAHLFLLRTVYIGRQPKDHISQLTGSLDSTPANQRKKVIISLISRVPFYFTKVEPSPFFFFFLTLPSPQIHVALVTGHYQLLVGGAGPWKARFTDPSCQNIFGPPYWVIGVSSLYDI